QCKGRREVVDGGVEVIKGLHERGYKLGIISNLIGENEVPDWLEEDGLDSYFDTVILSSVCHMRKPCSEIYDLACQQIGVKPEECVSVADNIKRDIAGAKKAGIGCNIIFRSPEKKHPVEFTEENRPDYVIEDFREILNILP
ncbi:MAG: HAD family hydrolase, partial [Dysosmobacter sp.]